MLAQAAVCQGSCPCGAGQRVETTAAHLHHVSDPADGLVTVAASHDHQADGSSVSPAGTALTGCCCARVEAANPPLATGRPPAISAPGRGAVPAPAWLVTSDAALAVAWQVRALQAALATTVAPPPLILRI
jgi:hypothetical protein